MKRFKRAFFTLIALLFLFSVTASCKKVATESIHKQAFSPYYVNHSVLTDEFGTAQYKEGQQENLSYGIFYPKSEDVDQSAIFSDAVSTFIATYVKRTSESTQPAELHINYTSCKITDAVASVRFFGFLKTGQGDRELRSPLSQSILLNLQTNSVIAPADAIEPEAGKITLQQVLATSLQAQENTEFSTIALSTEKLFNAAQFAKDGAAFSFLPGTFSAAQVEEIQVFMPYESFVFALEPSFAGLLGLKQSYYIPFNPDINVDKPMIALTFDDGPTKSVTPKLLELLDKHNAQATFFIVGHRIENHKSILIDMAQRGHEIGNHTWDHEYFFDQTEEEAFADTKSVNDKVYEYTHQKVRLLRPPGGHVVDTTQQQCATLGMSIVHWNIDSEDWKSRDFAIMYPHILNSNPQDGAIILCHDLYSATYESMEKLIPFLKAKGYQLVTVSDLLYYKGLATGSGEIYYSG